MWFVETFHSHVNRLIKETNMLIFFKFPVLKRNIRFCGGKKGEHQTGNKELRGLVKVGHKKG